MPVTNQAERTIPFGPWQLYKIDEPRTRRVVQVVPGLLLFGVAMALAIEAELGVSPWTVFHQGVAERTGLTIGTITVLVGVALVLFLYPFLREPVGLGTLFNATVIGPAIDVTQWLIPDVESIPVRVAMLAAAPVILGLGSGLYIGAGLGPGPRDGLMVWLERRGLRIWQGRALVEFTALLVGWILGGNVGLGTIWMALSISWFVDLFLRPPLRIDA